MNYIWRPDEKFHCIRSDGSDKIADDVAYNYDGCSEFNVETFLVADDK